VRVRRLSLAVSFALAVAAPLWHLSRDAREASGVGADGRWARVAKALPAPSSPPVVGAPWSVELFGIEFLDPLAAAGVAVARRFDPRALFGLGVVLALVVALGRFFCGWICPYVPILAVTRSARGLLRRLGWKPRDRRIPTGAGRGVLLAVLAASAVGGTQLVPLVYPPAIIGREMFRAIFFGGLGASALVVAAAFLLDTFVSPSLFCRSLCPGGALLSLLSPLSVVRLRRDAAQCDDCRICDLICELGQKPMTDQVGSGCERCGKCVASCPTGALAFSFGAPGKTRPAPVPGGALPRRSMFAAIFVVAGAALGTAARAATRAVRLRPPGARSEDDFKRRCIRCFRCAEVCPPKAIRLGGPLEAFDADLPYLDVAERACVLCVKCTEVCPTGALERLPANLAELQKKLRMGRPALDRERCLPWRGEGVCRLCYDVCPYPDSAVALVGPQKAPLFEAKSCVGCGLCAEACPSTARAITIAPTRGER